MKTNRITAWPNSPPLVSAIGACSNLRQQPLGEEFYQSLLLIEAGLRCEGLQQTAKLRDEFDLLFEIENPWRPQIVTVFRRLRDAAIDAASFLTAAHENTRRDALLKAQSVLEEARQLANEIYEPECSLLLAVIEHWRQMFAVEGGRVASQIEVDHLPNPYVAGRPIRPEDGRVEPEIFTYLRGITQTGRGFALLFAGLHTLEQMTREYWNPFFASVQTIPIGYLSELDARQLITDPIDQFPLNYEEKAIDRIAEVTQAHPYLAQSVCHNLVNRLNDPLHHSNRATAQDVDAVLDRTLGSSGYYFEDYVWKRSNGNERVALSLIADAGEWAGFPLLEKHLGRESALAATRNLAARDIITECSDHGELIFRFQIPLSQMWVRRVKPSARVLLEEGKV